MSWILGRRGDPIPVALTSLRNVWQTSQYNRAVPAVETKNAGHFGPGRSRSRFPAQAARAATALAGGGTSPGLPEFGGRPHDTPFGPSTAVRAGPSGSPHRLS